MRIEIVITREFLGLRNDGPATRITQQVKLWEEEGKGRISRVREVGSGAYNINVILLWSMEIFFFLFTRGLLLLGGMDGFQSYSTESHTQLLLRGE